MILTWHCPKCGKSLEAEGAITVDGAECPVFQCDACVVSVEMFGERFDGAFTFAVAPGGRPFDPAAAATGQDIVDGA
jgi:hypothetical protein